MVYTEINLRQKDAARKIIRQRTLYTTGLGFLPIPLLDAVSIMGIQIWMIRDIAKVYNVPFQSHRVKSVISSLVGNLGTMGIIKFVPGLGSLLGATAVSAGATATTYALGQVFMEHFSQGGTLLDFDPIKSRAYFQKVYKDREQKNTAQAAKAAETNHLTVYKDAPTIDS